MTTARVPPPEVRSDNTLQVLQWMVDRLVHLDICIDEMKRKVGVLTEWRRSEETRELVSLERIEAVKAERRRYTGLLGKALDELPKAIAGGLLLGAGWLLRTIT